jgi:hypothetical protein
MTITGKQLPPPEKFGGRIGRRRAETGLDGEGTAKMAVRGT